MTLGFDNPAFDVTMVIFGAIFLFICLTGGGIKVIGINFPSVAGGFRFMSAVIGVILIALGFAAFSSAPQNVILPDEPSTNEGTQDEGPSTNEQGSRPTLTNLVEPEAVLPVNYSCPYRADGIWLQLPGIEYGPFLAANGVAYSIGYDQQSIYVANSINGSIGTFADPIHSRQRNQWLTLSGTPFLACVDMTGSVFTAFIP